MKSKIKESRKILMLIKEKKREFAQSIKFIE